MGVLTPSGPCPGAELMASTGMWPSSSVSQFPHSPLTSLKLFFSPFLTLIPGLTTSSPRSNQSQTRVLILRPSQAWLPTFGGPQCQVSLALWAVMDGSAQAGGGDGGGPGRFLEKEQKHKAQRRGVGHSAAPPCFSTAPPRPLPSTAVP